MVGDAVPSQQIDETLSEVIERHARLLTIAATGSRVPNLPDQQFSWLDGLIRPAPSASQ